MADFFMYAFNVFVRLVIVFLTIVSVVAIAMSGGFFMAWFLRLTHPDFVERFGTFSIVLADAAFLLLITIYWSRDDIKYVSRNLFAREFTREKARDVNSLSEARRE